jgi:outer membrane protein assembly factor BamB
MSRRVMPEGGPMHWLRSMLWIVLVGLTVAPAYAEDWPQWLGPRRDNSSTEKVVPWKDKLRVLWRRPTGEGNSSPVVVGGRVFIHAKIKDKNEEEVVAFDAKSGRELWRTKYERAAFTSFYGNGPRATPCVVDGRLYAFGITGVLTCLDVNNGKQIWQVDTPKTFKLAKLPRFGMACSPLVVGDHVLVNVGAKGASIVAFDRTKGETTWKSLDDPASYASPIVFGEGAERQVVFLTGANVASLNPADGSVCWRFPMVDKLLESSTTPIRAGDLILASSITYGSVALQLEAKDGKPAVKQAWKNAALTSYFTTPVVVGKENIYMVTGSLPLLGKPHADLHCIEAKTGKTLWKREKIGTYHASLMRTGDDKVLMLTDGGELVLLEPDPKEYRERARSKVSGPETWAHPALSEGRLYIRDNTELICLQAAP